MFVSLCQVHFQQLTSPFCVFNCVSQVIELNDVLHLLYVVSLTKRVLGSPYLQIDKVVIHVVNLQPYQKIPTMVQPRFP